MPADPNAFAVTIGGSAWTGWTSIEVTNSLDALAPAFEIETTDLDPGQPASWPIQTGLAVTIAVGGELRLTGWIDAVEPSFDAENHAIRARGRGRCGDLVDCSAMNVPGRWTARSLEQIASDLCGPFGVSVTAIADTGDAFSVFALQVGESVKDALDRLCQARGVMPIETPTGDIQLVTAGTTAAAGTLGVGLNLLAGEGKHDASARHSLYVVKGSRQGTDADNGLSAAQAVGQATDPLVTRYRPLIILSEEQATNGTATDRAKFAATVRAGRSQTGSLTVQGTRDAAGSLWSANTLVNVDAAILGLQGSLLIRETVMRAGDEGVTTKVDVVRPEAYSLGEVKGVGLSRLDSRNAGRGAKARR